MNTRQRIAGGAGRAGILDSRPPDHMCKSEPSAGGWLDRAFGVQFRGKVAAIDGLRAVSILAVIGYHAEWPGFAGGGRGVDLFFVISGYLIASMLVREREQTGAISLKDFYRRRILRIVPAYVFFLIGYAVMCVVVFRSLLPRLGGSLIGAGLFSTDILYGWFDYHVLMAHTWSLSVEEQFYLLFPLFLVLTNHRLVTAGTAGLIAAVPLWRTAHFLTWGHAAPEYRYQYAPDARIDTILFGCMIAFLLTGSMKERVARWGGRPWVLVLGAALAVASIWAGDRWRSYHVTLGHSVTALGCAFILLYVLFNQQGRFARAMSAKPLQVIGRMSYSLYLWHPVGLGLSGRVGNHVPSWARGAAEFASYVGFAFVAAAVSLVFVEMPFLRRKERYATR